MSIKEVEDAILTIRAVVQEWDEACLKFWREDHTRYGIIDPIIRALGWKVSDPKECHPEYTASLLKGGAGWTTPCSGPQTCEPLARMWFRRTSSLSRNRCALRYPKER